MANIKNNVLKKFFFILLIFFTCFTLICCSNLVVKNNINASSDDNFYITTTKAVYGTDGAFYSEGDSIPDCVGFFTGVSNDGKYYYFQYNHHWDNEHIETISCDILTSSLPSEFFNLYPGCNPLSFKEIIVKNGYWAYFISILPNAFDFDNNVIPNSVGYFSFPSNIVFGSESIEYHYFTVFLDSKGDYIFLEDDINVVKVKYSSLSDEIKTFLLSKQEANIQFGVFDGKWIKCEVNNKIEHIKTTWNAERLEAYVFPESISFLGLAALFTTYTTYKYYIYFNLDVPPESLKITKLGFKGTWVKQNKEYDIDLKYSFDSVETLVYHVNFALFFTKRINVSWNVYEEGNWLHDGSYWNYRIVYSRKEWDIKEYDHFIKDGRILIYEYIKDYVIYNNIENNSNRDPLDIDSSTPGSNNGCNKTPSWLSGCSGCSGFFNNVKTIFVFACIFMFLFLFLKIFSKVKGLINNIRFNRANSLRSKNELYRQQEISKDINMKKKKQKKYKKTGQKYLDENLAKEKEKHLIENNKRIITSFKGDKKKRKKDEKEAKVLKK